MIRRAIFPIFLIFILNFSAGGTFAELVGYYPMSEESGTDILDASNYGHNGTAAAEPARVDGPEGFGRALFFDGTNPTPTWVNCGTWNPSERTGQLTVAFWLQWNGPNGQWQGVVAKRDGYDPAPDGLMMWYLEISQTGNNIFFGRRGQTAADGGIVPIGEWKHMAVSYDGTTATFYVDAEEINSGNFTFGPTEDATVLIGCDELNGYNGLNGAIDEVRLYDSALSREEIETVMFEVGTSVDQAFSPSPIDKAVEVPRDVVLSWRAGASAESHDVYFGADAAKVSNADRDNPLDVLVGQAQADTSYDPASLLDYDRTYYWRIDEVSDQGEIHKGKVWSFTTANFIVVDDFEDYTDFPPDEVWNTWIDGFDNPANGSTAGYPDPDFNVGEHYVETEIVYRGEQSMPLFYDNSAGLSEVVRTLESPADWTRAEDELMALALWFYGDPINSAEPFYIVMADSAGNMKVITHPNPNAVQLTGWQDWNVPLTDFTDAGVNLSSVKTLYLGLGNRDNPQPGGGTGHLFIDSIRVYQRRCVPSMAKPDYDFNNDCVVDDADLELLMEEYGRSSVLPQDVAEVYLEAESAASISSPMGIYNDSEASGGKYITVQAGSNSTDEPPTTGVARYDVTVRGGTYIIMARTIAPTGNDDSFWLRIQGATTQTNNHSSGWVRWDVLDSAEWNWGPVQSMDDAGAVVQFTMTAGTYTLEVAYREDGAQLDAILFSDDPNLDTNIFSTLQYDLNGDGTVDDADVALVMEHWLDEISWP